MTVLQKYLSPGAKFVFLPLNIEFWGILWKYLYNYLFDFAADISEAYISIQV